MNKTNKDELVTPGMLDEAVEAILIRIDNIVKTLASKEDLKKKNKK